MEVLALLLFHCSCKCQINLFETPSFGIYVKALNLEHMSLTFNTLHVSNVNTLPFTAHKEKATIFFYLYN